MRRTAATILTITLTATFGALTSPPASAVDAPVPAITSRVFTSAMDSQGGTYFGVEGVALETAKTVEMGGKTVTPRTVSTTSVWFNLPALSQGDYAVNLKLASGAVVASTFKVAYQNFDAEVLRLTNQARARGQDCGSTKYGKRAPLKASSKLAGVAAKHAKDMATRNYFSHYTKGSHKSPFQRMAAAGIRSSYRGENIAAGFFSPATVVRAWIKSHGHCVNMMNSRFKYLGVGHASSAKSTYGTYWVQDFRK